MYCAREDVKPLSTADFGKVMKQFFPSIRPRRLGTRGNFRYCYAVMRKTTNLESNRISFSYFFRLKVAFMQNSHLGSIEKRKQNRQKFGLNFRFSFCSLDQRSCMIYIFIR